MDHNYAREKLELLQRDLDRYNDGEFFRQMSRITEGATGYQGWEDMANGLKRINDAAKDCTGREPSLSVLLYAIDEVFTEAGLVTALPKK